MFSVNRIDVLNRLLKNSLMHGSFLPGMAFLILFLLPGFQPLQAQEFLPGKSAPYKYEVDRRIDNMGYWKKMAAWGLVPVAPEKKIPAATYKSSRLSDAPVVTYDSPDIPLTTLNSTQSENSLFVHPNDRFTILNSNNSSNNPYPGYFFGANDFFSFDGGSSWDGQINGAGGFNMGDPSTAINSNGRWFVGFIHSGGGQALAYSNDTGTTWKVRAIASPPQLTGGLLDKSHLWIDNSEDSPFKSYMYDGWTVITGPDDGKIQISRSTDKGLGWQMPVTVSDSVFAKNHNQGVNIATGPYGEVYAAWSIYDAFPGDENAIGFARSFNGGQSWQPAERIIDSIRGIRLRGVFREMRVNSFPSMTVDNSHSPWRGSIYLVWANVNYPGINSGNGTDIYMISSADSGSTWTEPMRINQDIPVPGKQHYFPWITCDPANGNLAVVFYDDRDAPAGQVEAWVAVSTDGGQNWQDFRVSDVAFTPSPVTGLADNYFGDYLGIAAREGMVYPCWTDNRSGTAMAYISPFQLGPAPGESYVTYQSYRFNDSLANGNGLPEYGETALLGLTLRNLGDTQDSLLHITISTESPYAVITDSAGFLEQISAGGSVELRDAFGIQLAGNVPNSTRIPVTVKVQNYQDSLFFSSFTIKVRAPELSILEMTVNDSTGNNNHSLDPGEQAKVKIGIQNISDYPATDVQCNFESLQPYVQVLSDTQFLGSLAPGEKIEAEFTVSIDEVTAGTVSAYRAQLSYSGQEQSREFYRKLGLIFEDWESADFSKFSWKQGGDNAWKIDSVYAVEGKYAVRSGTILKNQTTSFSLVSRALTYDSVAFLRKVSSEARFDFLNFYIDDQKVGLWSGEKDWERVVFPVVPGNHVFRWEYTKDPDIVSGLDAAFVDFIELPSVQYTTADAGKDATIYECQVFACKGIATYYDSLLWTSTGTGVFSDPDKVHTRYTPSSADKESGHVVLILTVYGSTVNELAVDSMNLVILPQPTAYAGPDAGICAGNSFEITASSATNYTSLFWGTPGGGSFNDPSMLRPMFTPSASDTAKGFAELVFVSYAGNNDACGVAMDTLLLTIHPLPVIPLQAAYKRCTGYSILLDATVPEGLNYAWMPGGQSGPELHLDSTGTGAGEKTISVEVTSIHGCTSMASTRIIFEECSEKVQAGEIYFRLFPNPGFGVFILELFSENRKTAWYQVSNAEGKVVHDSGTFEVEGILNRELQLSHLAQGNYLLTVYSDNRSVSLKLIVL